MLLRDSLQEHDQLLYKRMLQFNEKCLPLLEYSQAGQLKFTPHGLSHILAVESNCDWLLSETDIKALKPYEIFCLLCSIFIHDALMIPKYKGDEIEARRNHASRVSDFLKKNLDLLGINIHEASAISQVVMGHAEESFQNIMKEIVLRSTIVNIHKLSAILSLADICHADSTRAPEIVFRHLNLEEESADYWRLHLQISGITRKEDKIFMSAIYFTNNGIDAIIKYKNQIEKQLKIVNPYFCSELKPISGVELQAQEYKSPLDIPLKFQANLPAILDMLISGVYQRVDVFLRELVQNSLDACHLRAAKAFRRSEEYKPIIVITLFTIDGKLNSCRIDDNGIGMDIFDIRDTVLWIGNTISKKEDTQKLLREFNTGDNTGELIASFGIGLLSCLKSCKKIVIRSAKEDQEPIEFSITSIAERIIPTKSMDRTIGSSIFIELEDDLTTSLDLKQASTYYFRQVVRAPIKLLELEWSKETENLTRMEVQKIASTQANDIQSKNFNNIRGAFCQNQISGHDFNAVFWIRKGNASDSYIDMHEGEIEILNAGIFVSTDKTSEWLPEHLRTCMGIINFGPKAVDLPISREKVVRNKTYAEKRKEIEQKSIVIIEKLINMTNSENDNRNQDTAALILAYFFQSSKLKPQEILNSLSNFCVRLNSTFRNTKISQICEMQRKKIYIEYPQGRWVKDLTKLDGKQLYHKPDDVTQLKATLLRQNDEIVISALRADLNEEKVIEADLLQAYFKNTNIRLIDLTTDEEIDLLSQTKLITQPKRLKDAIPYNIHFIKMTGLPDKRSWVMGSTTLLNSAHPQSEKLYKLLKSKNLSKEQIDLIKVALDLLSYRFEDGIHKIMQILAFLGLSSETAP